MRLFYVLLFCWLHLSCQQLPPMIRAIRKWSKLLFLLQRTSTSKIVLA